MTTPTAAEVFTNMTDDALVAVVQSMDRQGLPLSRRFEGDDQPLREVMVVLGFRAEVGFMDLIAGMAMREALTRGLTIPAIN